MAGFAIVMMWLILVLIVVLPIALATYIVNGISMMKISKKLGVENGWLAFVPFANYWLLGRLAEEDQKVYYPEKKAVRWSVIYLVVVIVGMVLSGILGGIEGGVTAALEYSEHASASMAVLLVEGVYILLTGVLSLAMNALMAIVLYKFYHRMAEKSAIWMTLLSIFVSFAQPVILLVLAFSKKYPLVDTLAGEEMADGEAPVEAFAQQEVPEAVAVVAEEVQSPVEQ